MNSFCEKACKYIDRCRLDEEKTKGCKADIKPDGKIFGKTFEEINTLQHSATRK